MGEVNIIIETLCEKFGTTIQLLAPEMAKMNIIENIVIVAICGIIIIFLSKLIKKLIKRYKENPYDDFNIIWLIFAPIATAISIIILCVSLVELFGWIVFPTGKMIEEIIGMLKG